MFYSSVKDVTTGADGKRSDGHMSDEDYLTCNKIWTWKTWLIISIIVWKKMFCY